MSTGENIKRLRREAGYTQKQLAGIIGVKASYISALERGLRKPGQKLIPLLCDALAVDEMMLLYGPRVRLHPPTTLWDEIASLTDAQTTMVLRFIKMLKGQGNEGPDFLRANGPTSPRAAARQN